jgi:hypothetical protein
MGVGFALQILGRPLCSVLDNRNATLLGGALVLLGTVMLVWASMRYASVKGYPRGLGWLGLLSGPGLIVLFLLPDRRKQAALKASNESPEEGTG